MGEVMNILLVGDNETSKQYIHALKSGKRNSNISLIEMDDHAKNRLEDVHYFSSFTELKTALTHDLIIICKEWLKLIESIDQILSLSVPIMWDSQFIDKSEDIRSILHKIKGKDIKLFLSSQDRFEPQVVNVYENIEKGRIGKLGVINMKRYAPDLESHERELQAELETLYPYVNMVESVFAMDRKYNRNHYMTIILKLKIGSIINLEIYTGHIEFHRSGEFTGRKGVLNYSSELQTMVLKKMNHQVKKWTPTELNTCLKTIEYVLSESFDIGKTYTYLETHKRVLVVKEAILQSVIIGAPIYLRGISNV